MQRVGRKRLSFVGRKPQIARYDFALHCTYCGCSVEDGQIYRRIKGRVYHAICAQTQGWNCNAGDA